MKKQTRIKNGDICASNIRLFTISTRIEKFYICGCVHLASSYKKKQFPSIYNSSGQSNFPLIQTVVTTFLSAHFSPYPRDLISPFRTILLIIRDLWLKWAANRFSRSLESPSTFQSELDLPCCGWNLPSWKVLWGDLVIILMYRNGDFWCVMQFNGTLDRCDGLNKLRIHINT